MKKENNAIPRLMTFNWLPEEVAFVVTFHKPFYEFFSGQFKLPGRLMEDFLSRNSSLKFNLQNLEEGIGLDGCMRYLKGSELQEKISFYYKIPSMISFTEEICPDCEGTKISKMNDWKCYACRETGKKVIDNDEGIKSFYHFGMSVYIFCKLMDYCAMDYCPDVNEEHRKSYISENVSDQQTMMFQISEETGMTKAFAWAWLHDEVVKKFFEFNETEEMAVRNAMRSVEVMLFQKKDENIYGFRIFGNKEGKFWLQVPGSACTLGIEGQFGNNWEWGKILSPHNIDHRTAQISFLAGLTVLNEIAINKK